MRFRQVDKITSLVPGQAITAEFTLTGGEDYLRDHFPKFRVQPGVLMLESLYQASNFLVRSTEDFRSGLVMLREAKNIKFASFLQPGETLLIEAQIAKQDGKSYTIKATGSKGETLCVSGRLIVDCIESAEANSVDRFAAEYIRQIMKQLQQAAMV